MNKYDVYAHLDTEGRIIEINSSAFLTDYDGWTVIEKGVSGDKGQHAQGSYMPKSLHTDEGIHRYKLVDGKPQERTQEEIQADIDAIPPPPPDPLQVTQKAATVMFRALAQTDVITPADALDNAAMFPEWSNSIGQSAKAGSYWRHDGQLWRVNEGQTHTIQEEWAPDQNTALFSRAADPNEEWPPWIEPTGAHNYYKMDDKVLHNDKKWISELAVNTYEPGVYGWREQ